MGKRIRAVFGVFLLCVISGSAFAQGGRDRIVGRWLFGGNTIVVVDPDGTANSNLGPRLKWKAVAGKAGRTEYKFVWDKTFTDTLSLSDDGKYLRGKTQNNSHVEARRALDSEGPPDFSGHPQVSAEIDATAVQFPALAEGKSLREQRTLAVGGNSGSEFADRPDPASLLSGFHIYFGVDNDNRILSGIEPIYAHGSEKVSGALYGTRSGEPVTLEAKPGYGVAGVRLRTGTMVQSIQVTFMRLRPEGQLLDPSDAYESEFVGSTAGAQSKLIGGSGLPMMGVFGRADTAIKSVGLVQRLPDSPDAGAGRSTENLLTPAGEWNWGQGVTVTFKVDGSVLSNGVRTGTWFWLDKASSQLRIVWEKINLYDKFTLSADSNRMAGQNSDGVAVQFSRLNTVTASAAPDPEITRALGEFTSKVRPSLVLIAGPAGEGSGFICNLEGSPVLVTNIHVMAGIQGAAFKTLDSSPIEVGDATAAVNHDIFCLKVKKGGRPLEVMAGVDKNVAIGSEIVVMGNSEGAGVATAITGSVVGVGPNLIEVNAEFQPGNSGSPILDRASGKVIGVATYALIRRFDPMTGQPIKNPKVRRFGYRIDSVKQWQPVNWPAFYAERNRIDQIESLTGDLIAFLNNVSRNNFDPTRYKSATLRRALEQWNETSSKRSVSRTDAMSANRNLVATLRGAAAGDITAATGKINYDYFQRKLEVEKRDREQVSKVLQQIIDRMK